MINPTLNLIVLRAANPDALATFYSRLGLTFERHRHGTGPEHHAATVKGLTFEIYPLADATPTTSTRIGFQVADASATADQLEQAGATINVPAKPSPWGLRAVLTDPEGHKLELTSPQS